MTILDFKLSEDENSVLTFNIFEFQDLYSFFFAFAMFFAHATYVTPKLLNLET